MAKHVHLIGICGTAMASLAGMLRAEGHRVTGSDTAAYPPMSDQLRAMGIAIMEPYAANNLDSRPDLVVVGNAISRGNVELERVLDERIPMTSMAALIHDEFLCGRERFVVCGTHGKTTTTSMLAWIFETAAKGQGADGSQWKPSFLIGGVAENFGTSFHVEEGTRLFVLEGDEYDTAFFDKGPKFLHYFPDAAILTHVEFDHADIYSDLEAVKTAFKRMVNLIPRRGRLVAFDASENVTECSAKAFCKVERYGLMEGSYWRAVDLKQDGGATSWKLLRGGQEFAQLRLPMAGEHNALNATAAAALAAGRGIPVEAIEAAIASFKSVKRRLEVRAEVAGVTVIDDFAHHPTAIRETLRALRAAYAGRRLWAVLEPRSNTLRRNVFERELVESLSLADEVVLANVFKSEAIPVLERLEPSHVVEALRAKNVPAALCADADAIVSEMVPRVRFGDVIAILSNGGFGGIYEKLPKAIETNAHVERRR
ncbi:MAG TPA: UDP-N-acetylmuramate:L-alanyl-gamma-D-glutamyl-meso-diaminopimelate ligase [Acidobacteriaceae bacterium]|jgi:UDP-N-acetylmuramate: L-alanyl-gamma-D-glutamyl-meso-diaminopimelate ligase|nr:UDP-N-acetylmuramate:L-alanyl-gamma-D-glutamyl-meso-diaminopimelate ligase [Acidobacteriaceae bacterium]